MEKSEKRKPQRLPIDHTVFMATGAGVPLKCRMTDISLTGTRITLSNPKMAPQEFLILFNNGLTRWCEVIWRSKSEIGIKFVSPPKSLKKRPAKVEQETNGSPQAADGSA